MTARNFSIYKAPIKNPIPVKSVSLAELAELIRSDAYKAETEALRGASCPEAKTKIKDTRFNYVTFSGIFKNRAKSGLLERSCYFCIDLDHVGSLSALQALNKQIRAIIEPALIFVSPSGDGLKVVYEIDPSGGSH